MLRKIQPIITIILGAAIYAFWSYLFCCSPSSLRGRSNWCHSNYILSLKIPVSLMNLLINIPLFILAWKIFGPKTLYSSLLGTFSLSVWLAVFERIPLQFDLQGDLIIVSLVSGVLLGIGLGVIFNAGGTTGGSDIVARILNKYTNISIGKLLFGIDFFILMLIFILFQDLRLVTYTLFVRFYHHTCH